jgi:hypothetical protein
MRLSLDQVWENQGIELEAQIFVWNFLQPSSLKEIWKNQDRPTGLGYRRNDVKVTLRSPMRFLFFWGRFWGLGGSIGVQLWWLGPQTKAKSK